ncbi:class I SAM-dependent methyltransferase [Iningainema tapete]|uniref:Class I SAM-dependent methyltransferase n=1 Tax=Iningainema tapete BLCC-T55 TaxID=2748662 RepID=A0A8J7CGF1_9CYAN|nr:class I SAM-dependent methyltransferase [Iningainema tapete]MBD2776280.1 class I SAM-dependent methyltransferase [Iningainema tapete BLCC-T55]
MNQKREFPDWDKLYQEGQVESMPWFNPELDVDLKLGLTKLNINTGKALDLGTGPGTQAIALAQRGFQVTATDLSGAAIGQAQEKAQEKGLHISFQQDDILNSKLNEEFDFVFDRGCFHVFHPEQRQDYVQVVHTLIKPKGYLFLKCFSHLEQRESGPYRFTSEEIKEIFLHRFNLISTQETVYQGNLDPLPKALFCILEKC